jgi:hypothetical protein
MPDPPQRWAERLLWFLSWSQERNMGNDNWQYYFYLPTENPEEPFLRKEPKGLP